MFYTASIIRRIVKLTLKAVKNHHHEGRFQVNQTLQQSSKTVNNTENTTNTINRKEINIKSAESQFVKKNSDSKVGKYLRGDRLNTLAKCESRHLFLLEASPYVVLSLSARQFTTTRQSRSRVLSATELRKSMEHLTDQFMETRELLSDARESIGTVYFSEDMDEARTAVITTLEQYENLLNQLCEDQKQEVLRTVGLKMEELKAQEQSIRDSLKD